MHADLHAALTNFLSSRRRVGGATGNISVGLHVTRLGVERGLPIQKRLLQTTQASGQVAGLGAGRIKSILKGHGIERQLSSEGGRTNRGSLAIANDFADLLNGALGNGWLGKSLDQQKDSLHEVEDWLVDRVREFFNAQKLRISLDLSQTVTQLVGTLLAEARERQANLAGQMYEGAVLQHLVGAKLDMLLGAGNLKHQKYSTADQSRAGDFDVDDSAVHVTASPGEALILKAKGNLSRGRRPVLVVPEARVAAARQLAENAGIAPRLEIWPIEVLLSTNINERAAFKTGGVKTEFMALVTRYNEIITEVETDGSLGIEFK